MLMNVPVPCDWANDFLVDMIPSARSPGSAAAPYDEIFADRHGCGPTGWPLTDFGLVIITNKAAGHLTGRHQLVIGGGAAAVTTVDSPGVIITPITPGNASAYWIDCDATAVNIWLAFTAINGPIQTIHLWRGGDPGNNILTAAAKAALANFSGIRTMNWGTNNSQDIEWADRATPGSAPRHRYIKHFPDGSDLPWGMSSGAGLESYPMVPWETHIAAAAELQKDLWICVPAMASDDYIQKLAALFGATFPTNLTLYVEYGNETWDALFEANLWMVFDGQPTAGSWDAFRAKRAARTIFVSDTFKAALKNVRIVDAGQVGYNPSTEWQASDIAAIKAAGRDPSKVIDMIALAPYVDLVYPPVLDANGQPEKDQWGNPVAPTEAQKLAFIAAQTPAQLCAALLTAVNGWVTDQLTAYAAFAQANGIAGGVAVYEWGVEPAVLAAIRNTPEGAAFIAAFAKLLAAKTSAACFFDLAGDGYSILDTLDAPYTSAFTALSVVIGPNAPPPPTITPTVPTTPTPLHLDAKALSGNIPGGVFSPADNSIRFPGVGNCIFVLPASLAPAIYVLNVTVANPATTRIPRVRVFVGNDAGHEIYPRAGALKLMVWAYSLTGGQTVRIEATDPGLVIKAIDLVPVGT